MHGGWAMSSSLAGTLVGWDSSIGGWSMFPGENYIDRPATLPLTYTATLDNTSNNDTTCKTIQDIHARQGLPEWNREEMQLP